MILEKPILPFGEWVLAYLPLACLIIFGIVAIGLFVGYLFTAVRHGPMAAFVFTGRTLVNGFRELGQISSRRVLSLAKLAFKESIRSWVVIAYIVFVVFLLFAGWFLDVGSDDPARLYISFVIHAATYPVVFLALFLGAFSLPNDVKSRTIYTVVTKPVRAWEIVLGRILGFSAIGTIMVALMAVSSYAFVTQGLKHSHVVESDSVREVLTSSGELREYEGQTTRDSQTRLSGAGHRHTFVLDSDGNGSTQVQMGHWHDVRRDESGDKLTYTLSPPREQLQSRVPIGGKLRFLDRDGNPAPGGISVGKEWRYRDYVEGGTDAAAIWRFDGITRDQFPKGFNVEMTIRVFRTYVGDIDRPIQGQIVLRNPTTLLESQPIRFGAEEFAPQQFPIQREQKVRRGGEIMTADLFDDLVQNGSIELVVQCIEPAQYFGMAQADLYVRAGNSPFVVNFVKGFLGIWFQMLLVVGFGVMFSTFLNGAVAMLATLSTIVMGFFSGFILQVATGEAEGGGPLEATVRVLTQSNLVTPLEEGVGTDVLLGFDKAILVIMQIVAYLLPDFGQFRTVNFVASGYHVPGVLVAQHFVVCLLYVMVLTCIGYFCLKTREIAA